MALQTPAADEAQQDHDHRNHQQYVNETTDGVRGNQSEQPKYDQDDGNCIEHDVSFDGDVQVCQRHAPRQAAIIFQWAEVAGSDLIIGAAFGIFRTLAYITMVAAIFNPA